MHKYLKRLGSGLGRRSRSSLSVALLLSATVVLLLTVCSQQALAFPPANDNFANAQVLGPSLPIELSATNVGATKEPFENVGTFAAGHSVWFEWEATSTEWVTVGSCEGDLRTVLGVFTGAALNSLTRVASGNSSEGPHCPFTGSEYTFKATAGTSYVIAVDGNGFYVEPPPPPTEGEFTLRIEATPPPTNDDFANATTLEGKTTEEPGGSRFYYASTVGYNWTATTEAGEPFYGTISGASVWYTWTAPESGKYRFNGPCCGGGLNWGLYVGGSIDELTQVLAATGSAEVMVLAGTTYRISVYGTPDLGTGEPSMGSFTFSISANLPPPPPPPSAGGDIARAFPLGTTLPDTTISERVLKRRPPIFVFGFHSSEPGSTFRCKLDKRPIAVCPASERFGNLKPGRHTLKAFAVDAAGNGDSTPAVVRFRVPGKFRGAIRSVANESADSRPAVIPTSRGPVGGDCVGQIALAPRPARLRYTVWCGVRPGRVRFRVGEASGQALRSFSRSAPAVGAGASRAFSCRPSHASALCLGRASGPLTVHGTVAVSSADRCSEQFFLNLGNNRYVGSPRGCPHDSAEPAPQFGYVKHFRREFGLDADLAGNPTPIRQRILGLISAWRRGSPVARWTVSNVGVPMSAADQRLFEYHEDYIGQFLGEIEPWVAKHANATYAGYAVDREHGGIIYLGFTQDQDATIEALKRDVPLIAPDRVQPFPVPPTYTERQLNHLVTDVLEPLGSKLSSLINESGVDVLANKVEVGTEHVEKVKELIEAKYGPDAPFEVVFARPGIQF